ncbi:MAG TPA: hypothetical protein VFT18_09370 [Gaiellaceae bacterium]|nr:hypothetical protein [Gaiellaceae bacterium]
MRRRKRFTIIRIGVALAALAIPATAQAKPLPTDQSKAQYQLGPTYQIDGVGSSTSGLEIPYLSHGQGVDAAAFGGTVSPDDRNVSRTSTPAVKHVEIPYLSQGQGVTPAELGIGTSNSPDDRAFSKANNVEATVVSDDGTSIDVNPYAVTGFGLALLLAAGGMGLAIRHSRKGGLSPA